MKKCPFCAEEIQDEAIKCKHCGEFFDVSGHARLREEKLHWYFRKSYIVMALLCVGPLALPMIWWRPKTSLPWKAGLTVVILMVSWFLFQSTMQAIHTLEEYYPLLEGM